MNRWVAFTFWLLWVMLLWTWVYRYLFENLLSILLEIYPDMKLLDHMAVLFLTFWGTTILFSMVAAPFYYIPTNSVQRLQFIYILTNTFSFLSFLFFILVILTGTWWFLTVVLICISLMTSGFEHLFICLQTICVSSLEKCLFKFFAHFFFFFFILAAPRDLRDLSSLTRDWTRATVVKVPNSNH